MNRSKNQKSESKQRTRGKKASEVRCKQWWEQQSGETEGGRRCRDIGLTCSQQSAVGETCQTPFCNAERDLCAASRQHEQQQLSAHKVDDCTQAIPAWKFNGSGYFHTTGGSEFRDWLMVAKELNKRLHDWGHRSDARVMCECVCVCVAGLL